MEVKPKNIHIWTDGACSKNPGPGGWAWATTSTSKSGAFPSTTNNQMELQAVLMAVAYEAHQDKELVIHTDSNGVINWLTGKWKRNNPNIQTLCEAIEKVCSACNITLSFVKVEGHSGDTMNERVDAMAVDEYKRIR